MSFRLRLVLLTAAATALAVVGSSIAGYLIVRRDLHDQIADQLRARAAIHAANGYTNIRQRRPVGGQAVPEPPTLPRLISADGRVLAARYARLEYPITAEARAVAGGEQRSSLADIPYAGDRFKVLTVPAGPRRALQLAQTIGPVEETLDRLLLVLIGLSGAGVLAAPLVGLAVSGGALRPVRRLTRAAHGIARNGDLAYRIDVAGRDELASLAASFNAMLDRLAEMVQTVERARASQRQLVADASHELRTPLTSLRANVELLALGSDDGADRAELVSDVLEQLDGLTKLVSQLIELAREELHEPEREPVKLDQVVDETIRRMRQSYPQLEFSAELEPTSLLGARDSLARAVSNLVDNAAKWSHEGGLVEVSLRDGTLEVRDHGPGIDDADLPHVFERFFRGLGARDRRGSGLGLAIVAQVVSSHGGEVRAERAPGRGSVLTARFPTALRRNS